MLVLTRKPNQSIMIADDVEISVLSIVGDKVRIGIEAPKRVPIYRKEVYLQIVQERTGAPEAQPAAVDEQLARITEGPQSS